MISSWLRLVGYATFACLSLLLFLSTSGLVNAQQLSIRHYDVSDGLAQSHVTAMHQDAKGYLWIATWEGLSRFDGYRFTNYSQRDGFGDPIVNAIAEDRQGRLWVGTNGGGVARLIDDPASTPKESGVQARQKFISFRVGDSLKSNRVNALMFDSDNDLWCATDSGVYRGRTSQNGDLKFEAVIPNSQETDVAFLDRRGQLWFGMQHRLFQIVQNQIIEYGENDQLGAARISAIAEDPQGKLLVANENAIFGFVPANDPKERGAWKKWPLNLSNNQGVTSLLFDRSGALWIGTWNGLIKSRDGTQSRYTSFQGLSDNFVTTLDSDRDGNLWIGTVGGGVCKLSGDTIVSYTQTEGLPNQNVQKVIESHSGEIFASVQNGGISKIVEGKVETVKESQVSPFTNFNERVLQDRKGDWWIGTDKGLFRFAGPDLQMRSGHKFSKVEGIAEEPVMGGLYEDSAGNIWISQFGHGLVQFDPARNKPLQQIPADKIEPFGGVLRIIGDRSGALWLGANEQLGKLINGQVTMLKVSAGLPETNPRAFFIDSRGWLWIGLRYKGVSVTRDPTADAPVFENYSVERGLASDSVWTITEDDLGRIYLGTDKGLDQLDLNTGKIRHFNTDDGLASDIVNYCLKDKEGNIWVGTSLGLSKFNPRAERIDSGAPPIYISRVQIAGEELPLPETGAVTAPRLELSSSRNNLLIEYVALSFDGEDRLRYQYKLEGIDADWSPASDSRSINYARLAPGSYQFLVRAINEDGQISSAPAVFQFRILPPLWERWWFIALVIAIVALAIYTLYRYRVAQLLKLERVRTRIATDLHDDIGANLSLIAMLSEVARGQVSRDDSRLKEWLSTIATTSRDTVDSMSDIVWAVNPKRDHLRDLTRRMRRFADDIFAARNIEFQFQAPELDRDIRLGADLRREVFLIFKETINNAVRHSACTRAAVELSVKDRWLSLSVSDNGRGVDSKQTSDGTGLGSMRQRAERLGGSFHVEPANGDGTCVTLRVPLA